MALIKTIELVAQSNKGWEDAAQLAIEEACKSVRDIDSLYAGSQKGSGRKPAAIAKGRRFRINARISFVVGDEVDPLDEERPRSGRAVKAGQRR